MRAAIFDLDGTLVDSSADICAAFAVALRRQGYAEPDEAEVRALIGQPLSEMFPRFAPDADVGALIEGYRAWYIDHCADTTTVHPGAAELLAGLRAAGVRVGLATTKPTVTAVKVLEGVGLLGHFDHVQGTDGFAYKPEPDVVRHALAGLETPAGRDAWMIGDTTADILAGRAAGVSTAGVAFGIEGRDALVHAGADLVVDALEELEGLLVASAAARRD